MEELGVTKGQILNKLPTFDLDTSNISHWGQRKTNPDVIKTTVTRQCFYSTLFSSILFHSRVCSAPPERRVTAAFPVVLQGTVRHAAVIWQSVIQRENPDWTNDKAVPCECVFLWCSMNRHPHTRSDQRGPSQTLLEFAFSSPISSGVLLWHT